MLNIYLEAALEAARAAEDIIRHYYRVGAKVDMKSDHTPVTTADIESEGVIKDIILKRFPEHGFYGEETGSQGLDNDFVWLIDPIDGTKSFVRGYPFFSTQIALMHKGELVLGVSNAPGFKQLAYASKGDGAFLNGKPIRVSDIDQLRDAALSTGNIATLAQSPAWMALGELLPKVNRTRGYGDFYHYHLLAKGSIELVLESDVNILDIAALTVIVNEAGGKMTDFSGQPPGLDTTCVIASNGLLHSTLVDVVQVGVSQDG